MSKEEEDGQAHADILLFLLHLDLSQGSSSLSFKTHHFTPWSTAHKLKTSVKRRGTDGSNGTNVTNPSGWELCLTNTFSTSEPTRPFAFLWGIHTQEFLYSCVLDAYSAQRTSDMYHIPEKDEQYSGLKMITWLCCYSLGIMNMPFEL